MTGATRRGELKTITHQGLGCLYRVAASLSLVALDDGGSNIWGWVLGVGGVAVGAYLGCRTWDWAAADGRKQEQLLQNWTEYCAQHAQEFYEFKASSGRTAGRAIEGSLGLDARRGEHIGKLGNPRRVAVNNPSPLG